MNLMNRRPRRWLNKKELRTIKYETAEEWLAQGNEVTVIESHKPDIKTYLGQIKTRNKPKRKGAGK